MMGYAAGDDRTPGRGLAQARLQADGLAGRLDLKVGEVMRSATASMPS